MSELKPLELRSDTFTKPTPAMLEVMFNAEVGDDVFEEDTTVKKLEAKAAEMAKAYVPNPTDTTGNNVNVKAYAP